MFTSGAVFEEHSKVVVAEKFHGGIGCSAFLNGQNVMPCPAVVSAHCQLELAAIFRVLEVSVQISVLHERHSDDVGIAGVAVVYTVVAPLLLPADGGCIGSVEAACPSLSYGKEDAVVVELDKFRLITVIVGQRRP